MPEVARRFLPVIWPVVLILLVTGGLLIVAEPRRSLLKALRGVGHEASLQLAQERGRQRALADLARARQRLGALAAAAARLRRETERRDVLNAIADELRKLGFESAVLLAGPEGVTLAHMSHKRSVIDESMKLMLQPGPIRQEIDVILQTCLGETEALLRQKAHCVEVLRDYLLSNDFHRTGYFPGFLVISVGSGKHNYKEGEKQCNEVCV